MNLTRIILFGCCGKMGRVVAQCVKEKENCTIVAGIDINTQQYDDFPIFEKPDGFTGEADVIIDFSHPAGVNTMLEYACKKNIPTVISTTGFSEQQIEQIHQAAQSIPVFFSANMSLGVNLLVELARKAALLLSDDFDIEIVEKHHNQKIDAPSGTAIMLANEINHAVGDKYHYVYDRHTLRQKRDKKEIGIHAVRGGTIVGEHDIIFAGKDEVITLSHAAHSKKIFAVGSVNAALFLATRAPGLYTMADMV